MYARVKPTAERGCFHQTQQEALIMFEKWKQILDDKFFLNDYLEWVCFGVICHVILHLGLYQHYWRNTKYYKHIFSGMGKI